MAKKVIPLNDTQILKAKAKDKDYQLSDGKGLFLLVKTNGAKWWRFNYISPIDNKRKIISLGVYPDITLENARKLRDEARNKIANNIDISIERKETKQAIQETIKQEELQQTSTINAIVDSWLEFIQDQVTPDYHKRTKALLYNNIVSYIGTLNIADIEAMQLVEVVKKKEAEGYLDVTQRIWGLCGQIWKYAVANGKAKRNITADVDYKYVFKKHIQKNFEHYINANDLKALLTDINNYWGSPSVKYCLKLLPYVFVRPSNIRNAKWADIDFENKEWRIAMSEMKAPKAIKENSKGYFIVPLSNQVIEILKELQAINGQYDYLFTSNIVTRPISDGAINMALKRLGHNVVGHGFRHTASTIMNENKSKHGFSSDVIEVQMAHKSKEKIRATYNHAQYLDDRKKLMQWWSDYLESLQEALNAP